MEIVKVSTKKQLKQFIDFPHELYKNDPNYVPEIFIGQRDILTPGKGPFHETGKLQCFLAFENNKIIGRIAAIYNPNYVKFIQQNDGFFGFFDCINDVNVAKALFEEVKKWLLENKITGKIIGPANPTSNDTWGMLLKGFDSPPMAMMTYNFPYYNDLLQQLGYSKQSDLLAYVYERNTYNDTKVKRVAPLIKERLKKRGIVIRSIDFKHKFKEEAAKVKEVYNKAWDKNLGSIPMTDAEFDFLAKDLKMIVTPDLVQVAELDGKFIGISIAVPNINEILIKMKKGRLFPTGLFKLLFLKNKVTSFRIIILGVLEEYRKLGIEACFYASLIEVMEKSKHIQKVEASWILEQNEMMNKPIQDIGGVPYKTYRVYEKNINE